MSKKDKILLKFLSTPKDFTYSELKQLLKSLSYYKVSTGKTSGSRVAFFNDKNNHIIRLHKPHPTSILKSYQIELIKDELKRKGVLNEKSN